MVLAVGKELFLGRMREGEMPEIVKQCREPNHLPPCDQRFAVGEEVDIGMATAFVCDDVEDTAGQFHDAEGMFEPAMRRSGIDERRQRELVNVPKALEWARVDRRNFVGGDADEVVNGIADLVLMLRHG
jgi:alkanesulfonate monooxygenase SsuD/methylene tetrahydromethanopterin reductase-like flavin-dependent oxidoreductase (luciferase family)